MSVKRKPPPTKATTAGIEKSMSNREMRRRMNDFLIKCQPLVNPDRLADIQRRGREFRSYLENSRVGKTNV